MKTVKNAVLGALVSAWCGLALCAEPSAAMVTFDIEQQPLREALTAFAKQTGLQVMLREEDVEAGRETAQSVKGEMAPREALEQLLDQTELSYEFVTDRMVRISVRGATKEGRVDAEGDGSGSIRVAQAGGGEAAAPAEAAGGEEKVGDTQLEEIVVTAQKRQESLRDVPISIGVLSGQDLDRNGARGISDVLNQIGGVSLIERLPGNSEVAIRGVVPDVLSGTSVAGYYLDEVPFTFVFGPRLPDVNAFDLERVEVLRGPQGTLYGANALSGAVRVISRDADLNAFGMKGRVRGSRTKEGAGNFSGDLAANVPLIPGRLGVRAVASYADLSGFIDSAPSGAQDFNDAQLQAYRLKVNYQPSEDFSVELGLSRSRIDNEGNYNATDEDLVSALSDNLANHSEYTTYNLIAEQRWPVLSLLSSTSYVDYENPGRAEILFAGGFALNFFNQDNLYSFAQEFRLSSNIEGPWRWTGGAFYKDSRQVLYQDVRPLLEFVYRVSEESKSYAAFGDVTRAFGDGRYELTGGLRYFKDRGTSVQSSGFFGTVVPPTTADFDKLTGRVVFAYKPRNDRMFYGSVGTGFRSGLTQPPAVRETAANFPDLDPDSLINYEVGAKGALLGGRFTYDTAIYFTDWEDVQQGIVTQQGFVARLNGGKATGAGVDLGIAYHPSSNLELQASVGWNSLEFDQDIFAPVTTPQGVVDVLLFRKGDRVNYSPEWTGSVGFNYRIATPMPAITTVLSSNYSYRSSTIGRFLVNGVVPATESDVVRTWNATLGLEADRWTVSLFGDNLLNDLGAVTPPSLTEANNAVRQRPRTIGLQATFSY
jgi:iron complex outermembrane recepter protein